MKYLILLGDGMADFPLDELRGRTPVEAANTPHMDTLAREGLCGQFCPIPEGYPPGSDVGNLSMFGYDPTQMYTGRAPLEAASQGIALGDGEVAYRCNLVTLSDDGLMASFTAGHISSDEGAQIIETLNQELSDYPVRFHNGVGYRHLAVISSGDYSVDTLAGATCEPPHNISDREFAPYLPSGDASPLLLELMHRSQEILQDHPINVARKQDGNPPATSIWLWGQGRSPSMRTYDDLFGISGAVVSAVDLVRGIGVLAGLEILRVPGATGYLDTDYEGKVNASLDALERHDFAYLHIEAPDETAHEGRTDLKIQAIEDFDRNVVGPCLDFAKKRDDIRILVAPDHITAISTKTHAGGPVPFAIHGPGITSNDSACYGETVARNSGITIKHGHMLTQALIRQTEIDAETIGQVP